MDEEIISSNKEERKNTKRRWWFAGAGGAVLLLIAGAVLWRAQAEGWDFSWAALTGTPVAVVNGEGISRDAFRERLGISQGMLERQYGRGLFSGEQGSAVLVELQSEVLERMIQERLVSQEAKRLNISVTDTQVKEELEAIGKEVYGSAENFQASLKEEGISPGYLFSHIRTLLLRKEVDKARAVATAGGVPSGYWLVQARQEAKVDIYKTAGLAQAAGGAGSCCDLPGAAGENEAGGKGQTADPKSQAAQAGLAAFQKANPGAKGAQARVTDYGCHMQVDIEQAGKLVKSYIYQNGEATAL
jgi:hypothetical protein